MKKNNNFTVHEKGRYGGALPSSVKELAKAYLCDYTRRKVIVERSDDSDGNKLRYKRINAIIDSAIGRVFLMYGIQGKAAEIISDDLKSGLGSRSVKSVGAVGSFLSRKGYEHIRDDVLWFVAQELKLI